MTNANGQLNAGNGQDNMNVSAFIDWISVTHKGTGDKGSPVPYGLPTFKTPEKAHNGYTVGFKYKTGVIEMYNPSRPSMGIHVIYSGKVLHHIQETYNVSRNEVLQFHTTLNGRVARIDYAVDIRNAGIDLNQLWYELENKNAITKSGHTRTQSGGNKGTTLYVGSRKTRKKMLRVYDKAKEQKDFASDYVRVELETRQDVARNSTRYYQDNGYSAMSILQMVRGFCDFPSYAAWNRCFMDEPSSIPVGDKSIGNTEKWLLEQVSPALARVLIDNPQFLDIFLADVARNFEYIHASTQE